MGLWRDALWMLTSRLPGKVIWNDAEDGHGKAPLFERYLLFRLGGYAALIHHYLRPDPDRGLHDHPWARSRTFILAGWYREERLTGLDHGWEPQTEFNLRQAGDSAALSGTDFHRISQVSAGGVWTLFIHGPSTKGWGFLRLLSCRPEKGYTTYAYTQAAAFGGHKSDEEHWLPTIPEHLRAEP